ncbi:MAG TPA: hypothetical protein PLD05_15215 [Thermogutta sp.]|nr:hypothetical protein [Thermogutta sp.]
MTQRERILAISLAIFLGALTLQGCQKSVGVTVSGKVVYSGQPVTTGYVTFAPADGKGPSVGGPIVDGNYKVVGVPPGEKVVSVVGGGEIQFPKTSEEMARMTAKGQPLERSRQIPANAKGNNQKIVITKESKQTVDLSLEAPGP